MEAAALKAEEGAKKNFMEQSKKIKEESMKRQEERFEEAKRKEEK